jgi:hypothetical protein
MAFSFCDGLRSNGCGRLQCHAAASARQEARSSRRLPLPGPLFSIVLSAESCSSGAAAGCSQFEEQVLNRMKYFRANLILGGVFFPAVRP